MTQPSVLQLHRKHILLNMLLLKYKCTPSVSLAFTMARLLNWLNQASNKTQLSSNANNLHMYDDEVTMYVWAHSSKYVDE